MQTAYDVGARLTLSTNVLKVMAEVATKFTSFQGQLDKANESMKSMANSANALKNALSGLVGRGGGDGMARQAVAMEKASAQTLKTQEQAALLAAKGAAVQETAAAKMLAAKTREAEVAQRAQSEQARNANRMAEIAATTAAAQERSAMRVAELQERGAVRAAEIQQRAAAAQQRSAESLAQRNAQAAQRQAERDQRAAAVRAANRSHAYTAGSLGTDAMFVGGAGTAGLGLLGRGIHENMEMGHVRQVMLADRRITPAMADEAEAKAREIAKTAPGTTIAENLHAIQDLTGLTGSLKDGMEAAPKFQSLSTLLSAMAARQGRNSTPAYEAGKAMEIMGMMTEEVRNPVTGKMEQHLNPQLLGENMERMAKVAVATNGKVDPAMWLAFAKQSRAGGMLLDKDFLFEALPAIMQVQGGERTGTAIQSLSQVFTGNRLTPKSYDAMAGVGLADPRGHRTVIDPRTHKKKEVVDVQHGVYDMELLRRDPLAYVKAASARMTAHGIIGEEAQIAALQRISQRSPIAGLLADLLKDLPAIEKERERIRNLNPNLIQQFQDNDPIAKMQQLQAATTNLLTTLTGPLMEPVIHLIENLTVALNKMGDWATKNPGTATLIVEVAAGLSGLAVALATVAGSLMVAGAALRMAKFALTLGGLLGRAAPAAVVAAEGIGAGEAAAAGAGLATAGRFGLLGRLGGWVARKAPLLGTALLGYDMATTARDQYRQGGVAGMFNAPDSGEPPLTPGQRASMGIDGRPITAPQRSDLPQMHVTLQGQVNLDGRAVGNIVSNGMATAAERPPVGATNGVTVRSGGVGLPPAGP